VPDWARTRGYTHKTFSRTRTLSWWARAHLFFGISRSEEGRENLEQKDRVSDLVELQETIERRVGELDPRVELIALERPAAETLRLYIDHPEGVDLALCERVTNQLRDLLESWSLEVSSPGIDRPLTKPAHYRRYVGRRVRVRTEEAIDGRRNFTGTLTDADDESVSLDADGAAVRIPLAGIRRSNLIPELGGGSA
jgi:ribosome maturation factor RimP